VSAVTDFEMPDTMTLRPARRPVVGLAEFRAALSSMAHTVGVVAARRGEERIGRTVTSMLSLSATPPAILISIDMVSRLADFVVKTGGFSLQLLADDQQDVANAFAGQVVAEHRFGVGSWGEWPSGQPMLAGAVSVLDCELIGSIETGTHVLFAGAIVDAETPGGRSPLLWQQHAYHTLGGVD
jgi:flavin reductase (DIM6/NTAB) family NADH-FMN oxidoreductase RutF